jgi:long-chain acyl-CoA synthetase
VPVDQPSTHRRKVLDMREFCTPPVAPVPSRATLTDDVVANAADHPDQVCFSRPEAGGWTDVTAREFCEQVRAVAKGLVAAGVQAGDRVALMATTRYEWTLVDYAIWFAGAVTVPVYVTSSPEQLGWVLQDSGAVRVVVDTAARAAAVAAVTAGTGPAVHVIDEGGLAELRRLGAGVPEQTLEARRRAIGPGSPATLIYTSGTTGRPKGCALTHGNFLAEVGAALTELDALFEDPDAATLLFLPLPHVFARVVQVGAVRARVRLGHCGDARTLVRDLASFRPTFVLAVPRVYEKLFTTASQQAAADGQGALFDRGARTAIAVSRALEGRGPGPLLRARHRIYERLVYPRMRQALGGRCRYAVSGGAPLGERLGHLYRGIGLTVLEGYGLTETTAAVTLNRPGAVKVGTVGRPLPGVSVRVSDDGELLVRGNQVFDGYWGQPEATEAVLGADGWLRTGDVGEIDDEGFVRVTGRRREILVTAGGKNVAPSPLEDAVRGHPLVAQCMVVGDGRPFVAALVTVDADAVARWARAAGRDPGTLDVTTDAALHAEVQRAVDRANRSVSRAESIRRFTVLAGDWTEEGGQLTPSLKLRRAVVRRQLADEIEALYAH